MPPILVSTAKTTDTVIVGNGPSALILSYILHGHIPYYSKPHNDQYLDKKLTAGSDLLHTTTQVHDQFRSSLKYSSQALPFNNLLDTLLRPGGDTSVETEPCVEWRHESSSSVPHVVYGDASGIGGQWAENPVAASDEIGALSYAEQLSLPHYTFADHWKAIKGEEMPSLVRPSRADISSYYATYPTAVGIADSFRCREKVDGITRTKNGFHIRSHNIFCRHLVLASGTHNINIPPPQFLSPLSSLSSSQGPVLVIGSGFTAADLIISTPADRKLIHMYNWDPEHNPSPLRGCHSQAYPEYAEIYRQMKLAAARAGMTQERNPDSERPKKSPDLSSTLPHLANRNWKTGYEGLANARIISILKRPDDYNDADKGTGQDSQSPDDNTGQAAPSDLTATVLINQSVIGDGLTRTFNTFHYATGRRGSLAYLTSPVLKEILPSRDGVLLEPDAKNNGDGSLPPLSPQVTTNLAFDPHRAASISHDWAMDSSKDAQVSGQTLRDKISINGSNEVAPNVFAIGSLTGDSLVRFAYGACCMAAGKILDDYKGVSRKEYTNETVEEVVDPNHDENSKLDEIFPPAGMDGTSEIPQRTSSQHIGSFENYNFPRNSRSSAHHDTTIKRETSRRGTNDLDRRKKDMAQYKQARASLEGLTVFNTRGNRGSSSAKPVVASGGLSLEPTKSKKKSKGDDDDDGKGCIVC